MRRTGWKKVKDEPKRQHAEPTDTDTDTDKSGDGRRAAGAGAERRRAEGRKVETSAIVLTLEIRFKDIKIVVNHTFLYFGPFSKME